MRIFLVLALGLSLIGEPVWAKSPKTGDMAPPFVLKLVDGRSISLDDLRGNVIVLNFWATWCAPCKEELPLLDAYYDVNAKNGLKVFAITTRNSLPMVKLKKLFAVLRIPSVRSISGPYADLGAVPTNFVIDRSGRVRYARAGAFDLAALNAVLVPLLNEPVLTPATTATQ